ncbi:MAG: FecR family protein [Dysgonomonas sp.]
MKDKNELKSKLDILDVLNQIYERFLFGKTIEDGDANIVEKSSLIINNGYNDNQELLDKESEVINELYVNLAKRIREKKRVTKLRRIRHTMIYGLSAAAAILAFVLISQFIPRYDHSSSIQNMDENITCVSGDHIENITLADGTRISLNLNTHINYSKQNYNKDNREIWLDGEAYFDVAKDQDKPFIIHNKDFTITVVGTSFNVKSYSQLKKYVVSVTEGKVKIHKGEQSLGVLTKNKELTYNMQNNKFEIVQRDCGDINKWVDGSLIFTNADADELKFRMQQYYGSNIMVRGKALSGVMINGIYDKTNSPESVIKSICLLYNLEYTIDNGNIIISSFN